MRVYSGTETPTSPGTDSFISPKALSSRPRFRGHKATSQDWRSGLIPVVGRPRTKAQVTREVTDSWQQREQGPVDTADRCIHRDVYENNFIWKRDTFIFIQYASNPVFDTIMVSAHSYSSAVVYMNQNYQNINSGKLIAISNLVISINTKWNS